MATSPPPPPATTTTTTKILTRTTTSTSTSTSTSTKPADPSNPYPPCIFKTAEEKQLYRRLKTIYERHSATWDQDARDAWPSIVKRASLKASTVKKVMSHTIARTLTDENLTWAHVVVLRVIFKSKLFTSQKMLKIIRSKYPAANFNTFSYRDEYRPDGMKMGTAMKAGSTTTSSMKSGSEAYVETMDERADENMDDAPAKEVEEGTITDAPKTTRRAAAAAAAAAKSKKTSGKDSAETACELPVEAQRRIGWQGHDNGLQGEKDQDERGRERVADSAGPLLTARNDGRRITRASVRRGEMTTIKRANTRSQRSKAKQKNNNNNNNPQVGRNPTLPAMHALDGQDGQETTEQDSVVNAVDDAPPMATRDSEGDQQERSVRTSPDEQPAAGSAHPQPQPVEDQPRRTSSEIKQEATEGNPNLCPLNQPSTPERKPVIIPNETYAWTRNRTVEPQHHNPFHAASITSEDDHHPPLHAPLRHFGGRLHQPGSLPLNGHYVFNAPPAQSNAPNTANAPPAQPNAVNAVNAPPQPPPPEEPAADALPIPLSDFFLAKAKETEAFCRAFRAEEENRRLGSLPTPRGGNEVAFTSQTMRLDETLKRMAKKLADQDHALARITSTMTSERAMRLALQERLDSLERAVQRR